jgi:hypothetical protein
LQVLDSDQIQRFLTAYGEAGGKVNETTYKLIQKSIKENGLTVADLERAFFKAFENENFMTWANVLKYAKNEDELKVFDGGTW